MIIGLVRYLNARPLDYGFRQEDGLSEYKCLEDTPAKLYQMLSSGTLDAALVSSVECLRNEDRFGYCRSVGVCARKEVKSILYLRRNPFKRTDPVEYIYADSGSRTSTALVRLLYKEEFSGSPDPDIITTPPEQIPEKLDSNSAGLLIGDSALDFLQNPQSEQFEITDVAGWWYSQEKLPFVFALWAYPADRPVRDRFFEDSLKQGEKAIEQIIQQSGYPEASVYLKQILHYRIAEEELKSLTRFKERLLAADLL